MAKQGCGTKAVRREVKRRIGVLLTAPTWPAAVDQVLPTVRAAWDREIAALAESLRPRFEKGELHGYRISDHDRYKVSPHEKVERACEKWFSSSCGWANSMLALAASPRAEATDDNFRNPFHHVYTAAAYDVLAYARAHRWYRPAPKNEEVIV